MASSTYTDEMCEIIVSGWPAGMSAGQIAKKIAAELGTPCTRNVVVSFAYRNRDLCPMRSPEQARAIKHSGDMQRYRPHAAKKPAIPDAPLAAPVLIDGMPITIVELTPKMCAFAVTDEMPYQFCGTEVVANTRWCPAHAKAVRGPNLVYKPKHRGMAR